MKPAKLKTPTQKIQIEIDEPFTVIIKSADGEHSLSATVYVGNISKSTFERPKYTVEFISIVNGELQTNNKTK